MNPTTPTKQIRALLQKYFNAKQWYDGETEQTVEAINKLINEARIDELKRTLDVAELTKKTPDYNTITWVDDLITVTKDRIKSLTNSKGSKAKP